LRRERSASESTEIGREEVPAACDAIELRTPEIRGQWKCVKKNQRPAGPGVQVSKPTPGNVDVRLTQHSPIISGSRELEAGSRERRTESV